MTAPVYDFVKKYAVSGTVRAHMPGHKGIAQDCGFGAAYPYDITEIKGADFLFDACGIIAESEKNAAALFGTAETVYSCGGSTASIQTMLALCCGRGGKVAALRNVHRSFVSAAALLDLDVKWIYPEKAAGLASADISAETADRVLTEFLSRALYITSPDYLGHICDVKAIADAAHSHGAYLICDNAHGAYTAFLEKSLHPAHLGADICCDSAHKTLPVLTGGGYLHIMNEALTGRAKEYMQLFCSTSPSYLILQSLDLCNQYLSENFSEDLRRITDKISKLKSSLSPPYEFYGEEPLKLTVHTAPIGLTGYELAEILRSGGIEPEYADSSYTVLMFSPCNSDDDLRRTYDVLAGVKMPRIILRDEIKSLPRLKSAMSIRDAVFSESEKIPVENSAGRICARTASVCPPCIAAAVPGEIITGETAEIMKDLGIDEVAVVREKKL